MTKRNIKRIEKDMKSLPFLWKLEQLSFEDFIKWRSGEVDFDDIVVPTMGKDLISQND